MSEPDEKLYQRLDAERPCPNCAALESEVARLKRDNTLLLASVTDQVDTERAQLADGVCDWMALEAERDDANMQATANNEVATSLHEQLKDARALLRKLAAAVRALDGEIPYTTGWKRARETMLILLRRAEAEAGDAR